MGEKNVSLQRMAALLGKPNYQTVQKHLARETILVTNFLNMVEALGYEVVVQPISSGRRPPGSYVLGTTGESESENAQ
jgi:hypothetical protein